MMKMRLLPLGFLAVFTAALVAFVVAWSGPAGPTLPRENGESDRGPFITKATFTPTPTPTPTSTSTATATPTPTPTATPTATPTPTPTSTPTPTPAPTPTSTPTPAPTPTPASVATQGAGLTPNPDPAAAAPAGLPDTGGSPGDGPSQPPHIPLTALGGLILIAGSLTALRLGGRRG